MYAIVETGGTQFRVEPGMQFKTQLINGSPGDEVILDKVLMVSHNGEVKLGTPYLEGAQVKTKLVAQGRDKKVVIMKFKPKKDYRRKQGHRQPHTVLEVVSIEV